MAGAINIPIYSDALVVLGTAGVVVPLVHRWGFSPVLGYLGAGALLGPLGLGSFVSTFPALFWVSVTDAKNVSGIADLGVVFLLFLIGLELSYERLLAMRRLVFGFGFSQVLLSTICIAGILAFFGQKAPVAILLGACLALSSTAIVLEVLSNQNRMTTSVGRSSFAVLLAQDLAVIPLLMLVSIIGAQTDRSAFATVSIALLQAAAAVAIILLFGRAFLRPLFRSVARTQSSELFIATILFVIVATGLIAAVAGLSMALGAFVAGLLLAETEYSRAVEVTIEPFKGLLLGIFFFTVGMSIDVRELLREPFWLFVAVVGLITVKAAISIGLGRLFRLSWPTAVETGLLLGPGGEFAFVGVGLALSLNVVEPRVASFTLAVTSITMLLIPVLSVLGQRLKPLLETPAEPLPALTVRPPEQHQHAIVVGYGRVGQVVCSLLRRHGVPHTVVDNDPGTVTDNQEGETKVYYGDAATPDFLRACGLEDASAVILTIHSQSRIDSIVSQVRKLRPELPIVSRARDADHASRLYAIGVTDAVPETIESSLQLSEAALLSLGIATGPVIASIHDRRDEFRQELQKAAKLAGLKTTKAVASN